MNLHVNTAEWECANSKEELRSGQSYRFQEGIKDTVGIDTLNVVAINTGVFCLSVPYRRGLHIL